MKSTRLCMACDTGRRQGYLCRDCWFSLPQDSRVALRHSDDLAIRRLQELLEQLTSGVPLHEIEVTP